MITLNTATLKEAIKNYRNCDGWNDDPAIMLDTETGKCWTDENTVSNYRGYDVTYDASIVNISRMMEDEGGNPCNFSDMVTLCNDIIDYNTEEAEHVF
jgi:hypothetical protein